MVKKGENLAYKKYIPVEYTVEDYSDLFDEEVEYPEELWNSIVDKMDEQCHKERFDWRLEIFKYNKRLDD